MELFHMSEADLNGWLFVHCPPGISLPEAREMLELQIYELAKADGVTDEEEAAGAIGISPYWLFRIDSDRELRRLHSLSRRDYVREIKEAWEERKQEWRRRRGEG